MGIPAKIAATELDPGAELARPHLGVRSLQMVCRLLAYNAQLDLATRLNAYLDDPNEYRGVPGTCCTWAGPLLLAQQTSPSPSITPTRLAWHGHCASSWTRSTQHHLTSPATVDPSPTDYRQRRTPQSHRGRSPGETPGVGRGRSGSTRSEGPHTPGPPR
ncbi:MAG: hypothetical protein ACRDX8_11075 [Acidimicrobiales bacterium]